jgi:hypothetical protein
MQMKTLAFALLVLGIISLIYGGISYNRQRTVLDVGPLKATTTEKKNIPLSPVVGGLALIAGVALLMNQRKSVA